MHRTGRPGRGERGRVAARTRALLGVPEPARRGPRRGWLPDPVRDGRAEGDPDDDGARVRGPRWQPDRRSLLALLAVVAVVGGGTAWWVLSGRPSEVSVRAVAGPAPDAPTAVPGHALGAPAPSRSAPGVPAVATPVDLVVDVAGQVLHPGVYRLPTGSRVVDALRAAGGALPGVSTASLNLAAPLRDGQQVALGVPAAPDAAPGADPGGSGSAPGGPVDLNTAGREQLQSLPGVGPVLAQHILDWRAEHGRFTGVEQLTEVSGIGPAKFAALRAHVTV